MKHFFLAIITVFMCAVSPALAGEVYEAHTRVRLVANAAEVEPGQPFWLAVSLDPDDHWHTYWINPGDSGLATDIRWDMPEGFEAGPLRWPYPEVIETPPLIGYGYEDTVFLLSQVKVPADLKSGTKYTFKATVRWLACKVECVPGKAEITLSLPVGQQFVPDPRWAPLMDAALQRTPLEESRWEIWAQEQKDSFVIRLKPPGWGQYDLSQVYFFPYRDDLIRHSRPQTLERDDGGYRLSVEKAAIYPGVDRLKGILVSESGWEGYGSRRSLEVDLALDRRIPVAPLNGRWGWARPYVLPLVFAFIGGILLNLMPCVLPVLSIKILSFMEQAGQERQKVWHHGLLFTLGVLTAFWALAGILILLRLGGQQVGWGFQLQSPRFIVFLVSLFFLFALNLFGVFEIGTSFSGWGGRLTTNSGGRWAALFSGMLATIVATPCTAPFMGTALGVSLTRGPVFSFVIFTSLGIGMALPYLILSRFPVLLQYVPKPGEWMVRLKQFLGFFLLATVVWLLWILGLQRGLQSVITMLVALVLMALGAWTAGAWVSPKTRLRWRVLARIIAVSLIAGGIWLGFIGTKQETAPGRSPQTMPEQPGEISWRAFSPELIEQLRREKRLIFLDFTAAWCFTCQVNERVALDHKDVRARFKELNVTAVKADWTNHDERISRALADFGKNSIPLYVVYPPDPEKEPILLPEIITPRIVLDALDKAVNQGKIGGEL